MTFRRWIAGLAGALAVVLCVALIAPAVRATVTSAQNAITLLGNGSNTIWTFPFVGASAADITVTYTDATGAQTVLTQGTQYTLSLNAPATGAIWGIGGTVTYPLSGSPIASGTTITIARSLPYTQSVSSNQGQTFPRAVETGLDRLAMQIQQMAGTLGRAIAVPVTDTCSSIGALPTAVQRAGQIIGFDATGCNPIVAQPAAALVSAAMQPVMAASTINAATTLLGINTNFNVPVGFEGDWPGLTAPAYWKLEDGSAISRTTYSALLAVLAPVVPCTITSGSSTITGLSSTVGWGTGWVIESPGSAALGTGRAIATVGGSSVTISGGAATANASSCQVFPYGTAQDGTYNLPDRRGVFLAMRDGAGTHLTSTYCGGNPAALNAFCGEESTTLSTANLPPHYHSVFLNDPGHVHSYDKLRISYTGPGNAADVVPGTTGSAAGTNNVNSAVTGITVRDTTGGGGTADRTATTGSTMTATAFSRLPPTRTTNKIIFTGAP